MLTRSLCANAFAQCLTNSSVAFHHKKLCALSNTHKTIFTLSYMQGPGSEKSADRVLGDRYSHIWYANAQTTTPASPTVWTVSCCTTPARLVLSVCSLRVLTILELSCKTFSNSGQCRRKVEPCTGMNPPQQTLPLNGRRSLALTISSSPCSAPIDAAVVWHALRRCSRYSSATVGPISQRWLDGLSKET